MGTKVGDHLLVEVVSSLASVYAMILVRIECHVKWDISLDEELGEVHRVLYMDVVVCAPMN